MRQRQQVPKHVKEEILLKLPIEIEKVGTAKKAMENLAEEYGVAWQSIRNWRYQSPKTTLSTEPVIQKVTPPKVAAFSDLLGHLVMCRVMNVASYGAFVRLRDCPEVRGLLHVSEIAVSSSIKIEEFIVADQTLLLRVVRCEKRKLAFSLMQVKQPSFFVRQHMKTAGIDEDVTKPTLSGNDFSSLGPVVTHPNEDEELSDGFTNLGEIFKQKGVSDKMMEMVKSSHDVPLNEQSSETVESANPPVKLQNSAGNSSFLNLLRKTTGTLSAEAEEKAHSLADKYDPVQLGYVLAVSIKEIELDRGLYVLSHVEDNLKRGFL